ncbi:MAG TPA: TetR/AcrR family transcriptional regulator [Burkholderiaceae bacterium]|nr:TetR/AcrR family transcriptional regulator [Burkholderiaceae bacterium]
MSDPTRARTGRASSGRDGAAARDAAPAARAPRDASAPAPSSPKAPRRSHAQRREEAERRILEAALAIVASKGSVRMTLAEVGEAAGYSRGLPLHRFGSKSGLLKALAEHIVEGFRSERAATQTLSPGLASIRASINVYFSAKEENRLRARALIVMMTEASMDGSDLRETVAAYNRSVLRYFETHVREGIRAGEVEAGTDPRAVSVVLLGAMRGALLQRLTDDALRMTKVRDELLRIVDRL